MKNIAVVGSQWGDEGKGKIVDWLSEQADVVIRFQGGHNAGHTLVIDGTTYKLRVFRLLSNADNAGYKSFTIQAFEKPVNDTCATSENITLDTASATSINIA